MVIKIFFRLEYHCYICINGTISVYILCVSFGILIESIIILFTVTSMNMQDCKVYAKCYQPHPYVIQLSYGYINRIGFTG